MITQYGLNYEGWINKMKPLLEQEGINEKKYRELVNLFKKLNFSPKNANAWAFYFLTDKTKKEVSNLFNACLRESELKRRVKI